MPARTKAASLADQIAALEDPAPVDFDPENAENDVGSDSNESVADGEGAMSHYTEVGQSRLRDTEAERPVKAAYKGLKTSRKEIFDDNSDEDDETESGSEGDMVAFEEALDGSAESDSGSDQSDVVSRDDEEESASEIDSEDEREAEEYKRLLAEDQKAIVREVAESATADAQKGQAVKRQLSMYDSLLDARIKLQKGLQTTNMHFGDAPPPDTTHETGTRCEAAVLDFVETLFSLRDALMQVDQIPAAPTNTRKRKYNDGDPVEASLLWHDIQAVDTCLAPWRDQTLTKWSKKIQAAQGHDKVKKFKALNTGILAQLEESKSDRGKLLRRTQIKRYNTTSKTAAAETSTSIFDDGDFYQDMLKDLIDARMLDSTHGKNQMAWVAAAQPKQKKAHIDTRASKGRKLRYHVHEKLQNFMAPVSTGTWHEAQVDELFGSLFGQHLRVSEEDDEDEDEDDNDDDEHDEDVTVEVGDDYKIFG